MVILHSTEVKTKNIQFNDNQVIRNLEQAKTYKCLGMKEVKGLQHHQIDGKSKKVYKRRVKLVFKSKLNARSQITAINTLALLIFLYSHGIIDLKLDEIQDLNRITRKQL